MASDSSDQHLVTVQESTLRASTTTVHHVLKIQGYSWMSKSLNNCKGLRSKSFRVGDSTRWHMLFYPNGNLPDQTTDFVSVFAILDAAYLAVKAVIGFDVLDHTTGEPVLRYSRSDGGEVRNFPCVGALWGYEDFIQRQEVEKFILKDDCFSVRCNITVIELNAAAARHQRPAAVPPPHDLPRDFRELFQSGQGADVMFQVSGVAFAAHRCVLAARSPVFKAQLYGVMKESSVDHKLVQIEGMKAEVFRNLLLFAYTGELPPVSEDGTAAMAQHLLEAADRYGMESLKLLCEERLCKHIDVSTAVTTLVLAEQHSCNGLKQACFEFLLSSSTTLGSVMATDDFDHLSKSCPHLLKQLMFKLAACLDGWQRFRQWEEDGSHDLTLRTTQGDELPQPSHYV